MLHAQLFPLRCTLNKIQYLKPYFPNRPKQTAWWDASGRPQSWRTLSEMSSIKWTGLSFWGKICVRQWTKFCYKINTPNEHRKTLSLLLFGSRSSKIGYCCVFYFILSSSAVVTVEKWHCSVEQRLKPRCEKCAHYHYFDCRTCWVLILLVYNLLFDFQLDTEPMYWSFKLSILHLCIFLCFCLPLFYIQH